MGRVHRGVVGEGQVQADAAGVAPALRALVSLTVGEHDDDDIPTRCSECAMPPSSSGTIEVVPIARASRSQAIARWASR
ncbi:hypothetical protein TOK_4651 [Pseudonocardia sp. N23]|nr:hypothetical protein TOK_4651 [Pseudonocardia sp. N23]